MIWIDKTTHEYTASLRSHVRRSTRNMAFVAVGAATLQMVLEATYIFCL